MRPVLLVLLVLVSGCQAQGVLVAQLEGCGMLTDGELGPAALRSIYAPDACYEDCLAAASCEELEAALCRTSIDLLVACDRRCAFHCSDGTLIGVELRCDGLAQCADGGDESGCPGHVALRCDDGSSVVGRRCDGVSACPDGTDERDCERDVCDGWRTLWAWDYCDGYAACSDGRDEVGCPTYVCDDGTAITHRPGESPRCDGWWRCGDGSDEMGCATLALSCG
jgi:hypothetical protein